MNPFDQTSPEEATSNVFSGENTANPFPTFAHLRATGAIVPISISLGGADRQAWMVTQMEEAVRILKDQAHFTVDPRFLYGGHDLSEQQDAASSTPTNFFSPGGSMVSIDEPDHRRLRRLVSTAFTPKYMEGLRSRVQELANELLDQVQGQGQMDLIEDYAFPLPINVISDMLGVPHADRRQVHIWSGALANGLSLGGATQGANEALREFEAYAAHLAAEKRRHPAEDLISQLIAIEEEGDRLSARELFAMICLLIFAGHETTANLIGNGTLMLLDHPEQLQQLKADLSLVPAAVEELLRFNGPATMAGPRFATEDTEIAGQPIKRGDLVILSLLSANRDETVFAQSDELDIARALNRHIAFGHGVHVCLGAPLARLEGDIALTTLLSRLPNVRLSVPRESITWRVSSNLRGLTALPVAF
jgi:cytochrome P450